MGTVKEGAKLVILLSWPARQLWINRRAGHSHWQSIDAKTAALNEGCAETLHALQGERVFWQGKRLAVIIEGHKANKSSYDLDNLTGALKSHLDGIAATLGINDKQIDMITIIRGQPDKKNPHVTLEIRPL